VLSGGGSVFGVGDEGAEDNVGQSSFENSNGFGFVVTGCAASLQKGSGIRVVVRLHDCDSVDCGVELSVAGATESVSWVATRPHG